MPAPEPSRRSNPSASRLAVPRPSTVTGARYNQVSAEIFGATHQVLSGQASAEDALADLAQRLDRISRGGRW